MWIVAITDITGKTTNHKFEEHDDAIDYYNLQIEKQRANRKENLFEIKYPVNERSFVKK